MRYFNKKFVALVFIALIVFSIAPKPAYALGVGDQSLKLIR